MPIGSTYDGTEARAISAPEKSEAGMAQGILSDDLTEEELDEIFKDRRKTIEKRR